MSLYALRAPTLRGGGLFAPISREGALVMNNLLLATMTATVLLGTLYPLLLELTTGKTISVGAPYLHWRPSCRWRCRCCSLMAVGPFMGWKRGDVRGALQRLIAAGVAPSAPPSSRSGSRATGRCWRRSASLVGVWLLVGTLIEFMERIRLFRRQPGADLEPRARTCRAPPMA